MENDPLMTPNATRTHPPRQRTTSRITNMRESIKRSLDVDVVFHMSLGHVYIAF